MRNLESEFLLDPSVTFLNFGSFGATPRPVMEAMQKLQLEMEADPVDFIADRMPAMLREARQSLAGYVHCDADDLVYVPNPTYAVNVVATNMQLQQGDEILTTNIEYGACDKTWAYHCEKAGAKYVRVPITLPLTDAETFTEQLFSKVTPQTKLVFMSHITSATALRLPAEAVLKKAQQLGLPVFIDGAHVPGQFPLNLNDLQPDYYTGACHKWMMTAKGNSFFYVAKKHQPALEPLIVSWGYKALFRSASQFLDYHQMNGTRDYTPYLTTAPAIEFMQKHDWEDVAAECRALVKDYAGELCSILNTEPLAPLSDEFILQMFSAGITTAEPEKLHRLLHDKYKIQIPIMRQGENVYIRYSINGFNNAADFQKLFDALKQEIAAGTITVPGRRNF